MQDFPLTISTVIRHAQAVHADKEVLTLTPDGTCRSATFAQITARAAQLTHALRAIGVDAGDRVGTFMWNNQEHVEAYLAVPSLGAVLHTLNLRLSPSQLSFIVNHAEDVAVIVDGSLIGVFAPVLPMLDSVRTVIVTGDANLEPLDVPGKTVVRYDDLIADELTTYEWPQLDERAAAALCYTTGTTGDPKGVAYSHRSTFLHSMAALAKDGLQIGADDRLLAIVPQFHANAWGTIYAALMAGSDLLLPDRFLQAGPLVRLIHAYRPTIALAVPTIWADLATFLGREPSYDISSLEFVAVGGSAVSRELMEAFDKLGVTIYQAWGMTETSPLAAIARPAKHLEGEERWAVRVTQGRPVPGVELRLVDDAGATLPHDGRAIGELEACGPWITGSYFRADATTSFHDGWLKTGDLATIDPRGYVSLTDRAKDVIKSGGEWISSVELEMTLGAHPDVEECSVIGVPDPRWQERPLAVVVVRKGHSVTPERLRAYLSGRVAKWWIPERWTFVDEVPKTSVGKYDKRLLRERHAAGVLDVVTS